MMRNVQTGSWSWRRLGTVDPAELADTRLALHYGAQALASFAQALIEPREDDSHRSMAWHRGDGTLASDVSAGGLQARLCVPTFRLSVDRNGEELGSLDLKGTPPSGALGWLGSLLVDAGEVGGTLAWPEYDLPERPGGRDATMDPDEAALGELCAWFDDAAAVLAEEFGDVPAASSIRCWPHHFDIGTLLTFPSAEGQDDARYVGAGLSPGDEGRSSPYYYVNGWPAPEPGALPPLSGPGIWNTEGWVGGVLDADDIVALTSAEEQEALVRTFLSSAADAMKSAVLD